METILLSLILVVGLVILYFQIKNRPKQEENLNEKIKEELNSIKSSFSDSFGTMSRDIAKDMTGALTKVDEKVYNFNQQIKIINESQNNFSRILAGVKQYGGLSEFSLAGILEDLLPASQFIANAKMKPDESRDVVEFAVKLQNEVLCPIDSHWPIEKYKSVDEAFQKKDKDALLLARSGLASAFKIKSKSVSEKYINPPVTTDFAIVYVPTEGLYAELSSYRDPKTKELLLEELRKKYKVTIAGPNTLCAIIQAFHLGFQTLKIKKHATQIHDDLKIISTRFIKHFDNIKILRKKLEEAIKVTEDFGRDARSITRTLENIKDPERIEKATKEENVEKIDFKDKTNVL
ncbi:MAG: DNA recombination protein RmuC [Candidatus Pelagibacter sp. TMED106]|jgi:DNA recombination protein RmuC|nr:MAG: DNA recombination protein RmuC [Candidatus Pelagibacter sp. TMED106]|tara:strand:- start:373 stop:1416 length:1044 start_codon:yes stop_codon:yes gene_type:complete